MNRKFFKRAISFAMAAAVSFTTLCGITSVSASAEETQDVYRTIFRDDFEAGKNLENKNVYPVGWRDVVQFGTASTESKYFVDDSNNCWYELNVTPWCGYRFSKEIAKVNTGKHKVSFNVKAINNFTDKNKLWVSLQSTPNHLTENITNKNMFVIHADGGLTFNNWTHKTDEKITVAQKNTSFITADQIKNGIKITEEFDFINKKNTLFINDVQVYQGEMGDALYGDGITGIQFMSQPDNDTLNNYLIDNVKFETANDPVSVSNISVTRGGVDYGVDNAPVDSKQIKVKFDKDPGSDITKNVSLNDGTNNVTLNGKYDSSSKTYTATFSGLEAGKNYTLKIDKGIMGLAKDYSKTFSAVSVPWETTFSDDFENTKVVTDTSKDNLNKPERWDVAVGTGASNVGNSWIAADPGNASNKCLKIEKWHWANYRVQKNFESDYESGQYCISFKVKNQATSTNSYLDIDMSDETIIAANENNNGANRTMRIGAPAQSDQNGANTITFWNEVRKPVGDAKNGEITHTNKFDTAKLRNQWIEFVMTFDLDKRTCKVTADDVLVEEFALQDNYKLYGLQFRTIVYDNTNGNHSIWFVDDVKVEKVSSTLSVSSVKFTKGDKEYEINNVPAGATGVKVVFSDDVTDYVKDCVILTSGENNITVNGTYDKTTKTFTGTFDALTEDTAYVLKVDKNALFAPEDYTASFTTKGGLQLNDITFTPGSNNAVSVNYDITRISGSGTAVVIAAVYDGDRVVQAVSDNVTFGTDGSGKGTLNVTKTSAQTLKVFVWDSLNSFKPLFPVQPMTSGN